LAATIGLVTATVGFHAPLVAVGAFVPMLLISIGYSELNKADPDCGTTFTWATRAFGPKTGWAGGWGIIASDVLVMASLAEVAGQYGFLLFNAKASGTTRPALGCSSWACSSSSSWPTSVTGASRYRRGSSASCWPSKLVMLAVYAVVALIRVAVGHAPPGHMVPSLSWFNPTTVSPTALVDGLVLMLFIYWGWDTSLSCERGNQRQGSAPGVGRIIATVLLLATYALVTIAAQPSAGVGTTGIGLANPAHPHRRVVGSGHRGVRIGLDRLGLLAPLASHGALVGRRLHPTTILPTARTVLSMSVYKAVPDAFGTMHKEVPDPVGRDRGDGRDLGSDVRARTSSRAGNVIADSRHGHRVWIPSTTPDRLDVPVVLPQDADAKHS